MKERQEEVVQTSTKTNINNTLSVVEGNKSFGDDVYRAHKSRIENARKELYNGIIEQMKDVATTKISNEDAVNMRCSTFNKFVYVCNYIGRKEDIRLPRVYPALRAIGYNRCYADYKLSGSNVFSDINCLLDERGLTFDEDATRYMQKKPSFFDKTDSVMYRLHKNVRGETMHLALQCCISPADLILYYALQGLKTLVDKVPEYTLLKDEHPVSVSLNVLKDADKSLVKHRNILELLLP